MNSGGRARQPNYPSFIFFWTSRRNLAYAHFVVAFPQGRTSMTFRKSHARSGLFLAAVAGVFSTLASTAEARSQMQDLACPSQDFAEFFQAFSDSVEVQRAFTGDSVDFTTVDAEAQPEPREITVNRPLAAIVFPIVPDTAEQRREGLSAKFDKTEDGMARVTLEKPDTDYRLVYVFGDGDDCWALYAKVDTSL